MFFLHERKPMGIQLCFEPFDPLPKIILFNVLLSLSNKTIFIFDKNTIEMLRSVVRLLF